ncbi:MAG: FAD-dependent oxidoreductase [Hyphomicrobiaceae bacterium]|nr:FAD-dependent oxidoreductase [Hyphomicrobiaceae bacterium]
MAQDPIVIIGAGQAGAQAAQSLRANGYDGDLVMLGAEPHAPYQRPPLSKKYLSGDVSAENLALRPPAFYETNRIDLIAGAEATHIDPAGRRVETIAGQTIAYSKLLIATGTRARPLPLPGHDLDGVLTLRTIRDVDTLRPAFAPGARLVIVGGGYIGLEVAAVARARGLDVTVLEGAPRVLARVVAPPVSRFYQDLHRAHGVDIRLDQHLAGFTGGDRVTGIALADGTTVAADLVLVAIGALACDELATASGLATRDGIAVDAFTRASAPDIFAAGDCTRFTSALYGRDIRLESVQNAIDQAKAAAAAMLDIAAEPYDPVPWFWSDQYDVKLQIAGLSQGHDRAVVDGDPATASFSVSYYLGDRLLAVDAINRPRDHMLARRSIGKA